MEKIKPMKPLEDLKGVTGLVGIKTPGEDDIDFVLATKDGEKRRAVAMALRIEDFPDEGVPEIGSFEVSDVSKAKEVYLGNLGTIKGPARGTVILTANFKRPARARLEALKLFVFAK